MSRIYNIVKVLEDMSHNVVKIGLSKKKADKLLVSLRAEDRLSALMIVEEFN